MDDGDEYTKEQLEQEYEPMFLWSENPNNARWLSLAHVLYGIFDFYFGDRCESFISNGKPTTEQLKG